MPCFSFALFFFFNDTATPEIYTLPLHDALPISLLLSNDDVFSAAMPPPPIRYVGDSPTGIARNRIRFKALEQRVETRGPSTRELDRVDLRQSDVNVAERQIVNVQRDDVLLEVLVARRVQCHLQLVE